MQEFKRSHFKAERPHEAFPDISPLSSSAAASLRRRIARALGVSEHVDGLDVSCRISAAATLVPGVNAENSDFRISRVLLNEGITPEDFVFLDWYRFTEVDQVRLDDLEAYFDFIWYPAADDLFVLDGTISWILEIRHEGIVRLLRLDPT